MTPATDNHPANFDALICLIPGRPSEVASAVPEVLRVRRFGLRDAQLPSISEYRVFMTIILVCVILLDQWSDRRFSADVSSVVGPLSILVWALTLLGSFGIGPVAALWRAVRH